MLKIDISAVPKIRGTSYPSQFNAPCAECVRQRLGDAGGLTDFGGQFHAAAARQLVEPSATGIRTRMNSSLCSKAN
jgi:uncharacterized cupin superfamily protein